MARKHLFEPSVAETVIAYGVNIKGNLECENDLWVDGLIDGNIRCHGNVTIGLNARVEGSISANNVNVAGQVLGDVKALEKLILAQTGRLIGNTKAAGLAVADGGILIGQISMPDAADPAKDKGDAPKSDK